MVWVCFFLSAFLRWFIERPSEMSFGRLWLLAAPAAAVAGGLRCAELQSAKTQTVVFDHPHPSQCSANCIASRDTEIPIWDHSRLTVPQWGSAPGSPQPSPACLLSYDIACKGGLSTYHHAGNSQKISVLPSLA